MMIDFTAGDGSLAGACRDALAASFMDPDNTTPWAFRSMLAVRISNATEAIHISADEAAILDAVLPGWSD